MWRNAPSAAREPASASSSRASDGRALQVRDAMPCHERGEAMLVGRRRALQRCPLPQLIEWLEVSERDVGRHAEVDQAGDLVHADGREPVHPRRARIHRAEKSAGFVVALERVLQDALALLVGQRVQVERPAARVVARASLEGGEGPGVALEQVHRTAQVLDERLP